MASTGKLTGQSFECDLCSKVFVRKDNFERHKAKHTQILASGTESSDMMLSAQGVSKLTHEICPVCSKPVSRKFSLDRHMRYHRQNKQFVCEKCNRSYVERYGLLRHMQSMHSETGGAGADVETDQYPLKLTGGKVEREKYTYDCVMCGVGFKYKEMVEAHFEVMHQIQGRLRLRVE